MRLWPVALAMALPAVPLAAQDQEKSEGEGDEIVLIEPGDRDYIVVEGGVLARPLSDGADNIFYISSPDQGAGIRVENIIRDIPGMQQFRRSDARSANPTSQGLTTRGLGGNAASRTLLILDGIPQSDPFGGWVNWTAFDAVKLRGMRVVSGGGNGADGPGALAGMIQMSTDEHGFSSASFAYGSRNSIDADANVDLDVGHGSIVLGGNYSRGDGFIPTIASQRGAVDTQARYQSYGMGARFVFPIDPTTMSTNIEATIRAFDDRRSRGVPFSDNRNSGVDASIRALNRIGSLPWMALAYAQLRDFSSESGSISADRSSAAPTLDQFDVPSSGYGARFEIRPEIGKYQQYRGSNDRELRLGVDWRRTSGQTRENSNYVAGLPTRSREAGGMTETLGAFSEFSANARPFDVSASLRIDHWSIRDGQRRELNIDGSVRSDDRFADRSGWEWTGRLAASWALADRLKTKFSIYRGWRLPTLNELYRPFRVGTDATAANEALRPERLQGGEIRFESSLDPVDIGLTLFYNRLDDAIANVTLGTGPGNFPGVGFVGAGGIYRQRQNLDAIVSKGAEFNMGVSLARRIDVKLGYAYVDARVRGSGIAAPLNGLRPAQVPQHFVTTALEYDGATWQAGLKLRYSASQFEDDANSRQLADALTADAHFGYSFANGLGIELRAENLFDAQVEAAISSMGIIERASPRMLWLGVRLNFH